MQEPLFVQHLSIESEVVLNYQPYPGQNVRKDLLTSNPPGPEMGLWDHFAVQNLVFNLVATDFWIPRVHEENVSEDAH